MMTRWQEIASHVDAVTDRLGKPIEAGIKETVIAMNVLGFTTIASCEGHMDWSERAPWVDFAVEGVRESLRKAAAAHEKARRARRDGKRKKVVDDLFEQAHTLDRAAEAPLLVNALKLAEHLDLFYQGRTPSFHRRLILRQYGSWIRLISQGAMFQHIRDARTRTECLVEYQEEMRDFTAFMKHLCDKREHG